MTAGLLLANLGLLVIYLSAWVNPHAQNSRKTVVRPPTLAKEPVEITIEHRGQPVKANEEFEGDADWVKNLKLRLKNTSDKTITYLLLDLDFPETVPSTARVAQRQIAFGRGPDNQATRPALRLRPGETMELRLDTEYDGIRALVTRALPVESVSKMVVRLHQVMFDDDTLFSSGSMYRRNPDAADPHKWVKIGN
jgi:hypothetical protein